MRCTFVTRLSYYCAISPDLRGSRYVLTYTKDIIEASSAATPQTMMVALVSFDPVPPPEPCFPMSEGVAQLTLGIERPQDDGGSSKVLSTRDPHEPESG